ncbi:serine/threonine protein kinase PknE [Mycobacterium sp.]|uniref:serine/threonine protein kinase PknE n=1 Tax=Mycobacterium sp. TaxID=1785 RepID=UPI002C43A77B|nr:serine/threonine protein kinase PknE [Mycobacterium sp.]HTQ16312.1 serine/threonine protein kinase PknE [Mycobacterium sp.]
MEGTPFGRYRLVELLGSGGMGEVWRAYDTLTNRTVAIKVLPPHLAQDHTFVQRFRREAEAAAQLSSPHIIPIHDYGEVDGRLFVNMRLINGRDLATVLAAGPLEPGRAVRIVEQVAKALNAAHKVGLIHRDVKPSNILLDDDDFAYLIDFGIARAADETRLTKSGNTIGTFQYIAPERLGTGSEDARADIYSLACVLYECLTGQPPFTGDTMAPLVAAHLYNPPPQPSIAQPNLPPSVDQVIATGMAKDPAQRYSTTTEFAEAARDAVTVPIQRPVPPQAAAQPFALPAPVWTAPPPLPAPPTPPPTGGRTRGLTIALVTGAIVLVALIAAAAIGIPTFVKHQASQLSSAPSSPPPGSSQPPDTHSVRVTSSKLVTNPGTSDPKAVVALYEDFLCPMCGHFEQTFGPTVSKLIDIGAIAADYSFVAILDRGSQNYSSRAGAAAYCVADESIDAFRRFHTALFNPNIQPSESGSTFPDNARLIELAREAGVVGGVPDCVNSGKYLARVRGMSKAAHVNATPTVRINGEDFDPTTPDALVAKIKEIVGNVPGIDSAASP